MLYNNIIYIYINLSLYIYIFTQAGKFSESKITGSDCMCILNLERFCQMTLHKSQGHHIAQLKWSPFTLSPSELGNMAALTEDVPFILHQLT